MVPPTDPPGGVTPLSILLRSHPLTPQVHDATPPYPPTQPAKVTPTAPPCRGCGTYTSLILASDRHRWDMSSWVYSTKWSLSVFRRVFVCVCGGGLFPHLVHCPKSNPNFHDITWNVVENMILHELFRVVSRCPRYIHFMLYRGKWISFGTVYSTLFHLQHLRYVSFPTPSHPSSNLSSCPYLFALLILLYMLPSICSPIFQLPTPPLVLIIIPCLSLIHLLFHLFPPSTFLIHLKGTF